MPWLDDKTYNLMKWVAQFFLPGLATLYFALSQFWALPAPEQIVGSIVAFNVFLGAILGVSAYQYANNQWYRKALSAYTDPCEQQECNTDYPFAMSDKLYALLKWTTIILLPAVGTLYFAISEIWGLPNAEAVVGTIASVAAFLGIFLGINTKQFEKANA